MSCNRGRSLGEAQLPEAPLAVVSPQAELRALEEGDGSVSGSSPLSDGSQSASQDAARRLASKRGKWKLFVGAASPESASRGSSKTGRESPEAGDAGNWKRSLRREERVFRKAAALSAGVSVPRRFAWCLEPGRALRYVPGRGQARRGGCHCCHTQPGSWASSTSLTGSAQHGDKLMLCQILSFIL